MCVSNCIAPTAIGSGILVDETVHESGQLGGCNLQGWDSIKDRRYETPALGSRICNSYSRGGVSGGCSPTASLCRNSQIGVVSDI
jgi:hypothetical protein